MKTEHQKAWAYREASRVRRAHVLNYHGHYDIGQHSFGVLLLIMQLHPCPTVELLKAAAHHDIAERWVGDIPHQTKRRLDRNGDVSAMETEIELEWDLFPQANLFPDEKLWLKSCDLLELYMWCLEQQAMGNRMLDSVAERCRQSFEEWKQLKQIPSEVETFLDGLKWQPLEEMSV